MTVKAYDWLAHYADRTPDKRACYDVFSGRSFTFRQLNDRAACLATHLHKTCGVEKGDRIAAIAHNSTEFLEMQGACAKLGAILLPLNWRLTASELSYQIEDGGPKVLIYGPDFEDVVNEVVSQKEIPHLIDLKGDGSSCTYENIVTTTSPDLPAVDVTHDDTWKIIYTSGTTGRPKGALLTHGMAFYNAINYGIPNRINPQTVNLCVLPFFHTGGFNNCANPALFCGGSVVIARRFDPGQVLSLISDPDLGINNFMGVPAMYLALSQHPDFDTTDFSRLVNAGVGGAPVPISMHRLWRSRGVALQEGYGLTEGGPAVLVSEVDQPLEKAGSAGRPVLNVEVRLVDSDGKDVPQGEVGEIWARGPAITPGYWNNPEATREAITDGWLHTGDAARMDEDGYYYIVDRWKDMYISGGENVYPAEVENVLYELPQIAETAVVGVVDERWGEVGCAVVVLKEGESLSEADVLRHCDGKLARFKIPKSVVFIDALPRNAMGKVLKTELREKLGIGALVQK